MQNKFYGSKLNTILLFILIILMIWALIFMYKNKDVCYSIKDNKNMSSYFESDLGYQDSELKKDKAKDDLIEGNKDDLIYFSINPGDGLIGSLNAVGTVKGGYFFEGNILVNILDKNKKLLKAGHGTAVSNWMTSGEVNFHTFIDFSEGLPPHDGGEAYIEIKNDNPSDDRSKDKSILIPIFLI